MLRPWNLEYLYISRKGVNKAGLRTAFQTHRTEWWLLAFLGLAGQKRDSLMDSGFS